LSPIPPGASISPAPLAKLKKVAVNLPKETISGEGDEPSTRPPWARTPLPLLSGEGPQNVEPVQLITREAYPPDIWRRMMPEVIDVFLPGKVRCYTFEVSLKVNSIFMNSLPGMK
jgi:hypothetical protein